MEPPLAGATDASAQVALVVAAFLFGTSFIVVKGAVADVGPIPFLAARFLIGGVALLPFSRRRPRRAGERRAGLALGGALLAGYVLQTVGLQYTTSTASAFITYMLVVIVPLLSMVVVRRPPARSVVAAIPFVVGGLFLLSGKGLGLGRGEVLTLGCAFAFAVHIVLLGELSPRFDALRLNATQLLVVGAGCLVPGVWLGGYGFSVKVWGAALFTGVAVSSVALLLHVWAQRHVVPTRTALLLTLEPVFAAVFGFFAGDRLGGAAIAGALLILVGVTLAEVGPAMLASRGGR